MSRADEVRVTYRFRNHAEAPVTSLVAFPLPDVDASTEDEGNFVLPDPGSDNFVDFAVTVDGKPVTAAIDRHAFALGIDRTERADGASPAAQPGGGRSRREARQPGQGRAAGAEPSRSRPHPCKTACKRSGRCARPSTGSRPSRRAGRSSSSTATSRWPPMVSSVPAASTRTGTRPGTASTPISPGRRGRCSQSSATPENPYLEEIRISYILTTANNWASPIKSFRLVVDQGEPEALVSFCGDRREEDLAHPVRDDGNGLLPRA